MTDEEKRDELERIIQSISSGSELERIEKLHKKELKKYHNKGGS